MVALVETFARIYPDFQICPQSTAPATVAWNSVSPSVRAGVIQNNLKHTLTNEGLYACDSFQPEFIYGVGNKYVPYNSGGYLVVVNATNPDIYKFIASYCHLMGYGFEDNVLTVAQQKSAMRSRRIMLQCGDTSDVMVSLLQDQGIAARRVHLLGGFTDTTENGRDEGHVCIEVMIDGQWRFIDPSRDIYFIYNGVHPSFIQLKDIGVQNAQVVRLAPTEYTMGAECKPTIIKSTSPTITAISPQHRSYIDMTVATEAGARAWEQTIFKTYGWAHPTNGEIWYLNEGLSAAQQSWLLALSSAYKLKTRAQIITQFYS